MLKVFKINLLTYIYFLICFLSGYINESFTIFLIILIHELGHILATKILKYKILFCEIYPFGGITKVDRKINIPIIDELIIYLGGVIAQITTLIIMKLLGVKVGYIFYLYNWIIIVFNLLPIYPLDGFHILKCILQKYITYYNSLICMKYISIISLIVFIGISAFFRNIQIIIISFLIYQNIIYINEYKNIFFRFIIERYLNNISYKKISYLKDPNIKRLKRERFSYFTKNNKVFSEKDLIAKKFDINLSFW